ncbi:MAG: hypothetical protein LBT59_11990 [Clostridiales bacterium]|nr:hypothetical protein [Clostridiales bacterium]
MDNENKSFSYTYSAKQNEEVKKIRQKYMLNEENKLERLRRLDRNSEKLDTIVALVVGITSAIFFGIGLTCVLELTEYFLPGIVIGIIGIIGVSLAFLLYVFVTKKQREKIAPLIQKLSDELMLKQ